MTGLAFLASVSSLYLLPLHDTWSFPSPSLPAGLLSVPLDVHVSSGLPASAPLNPLHTQYEQTVRERQDKHEVQSSNLLSFCLCVLYVYLYILYVWPCILWCTYMGRKVAVNIMCLTHSPQFFFFLRQVFSLNPSSPNTAGAAGQHAQEIILPLPCLKSVLGYRHGA